MVWTWRKGGADGEQEGGVAGHRHMRQRLSGGVRLDLLIRIGTPYLHARTGGCRSPRSRCLLWQFTLRQPPRRSLDL